MKDRFHVHFMSCVTTIAFSLCSEPTQEQRQKKRVTSGVFFHFTVNKIYFEQKSLQLLLYIYRNDTEMMIDSWFSVSPHDMCFPSLDASNDTNLCSGQPVSAVTTLRNGTIVVFRG